MTFEKIRDWLSWGRVAFLVISVFGTFATFVAGKIYGASVRDAEIEQNTAQIRVQGERLNSHETQLIRADLRLTALEATQQDLLKSVRNLEAAVGASNGKLDFLITQLTPGKKYE